MAGTDGEQEARQYSEQDSGRGGRQDNGQDATRASGQDGGEDGGRDVTRDGGQDGERDATQNSEQDGGRDGGQDGGLGGGRDGSRGGAPEGGVGTERVLAGVGARLRGLRQAAGLTLAALSAATGISVSTLSRLESGSRRPSLELLLPLAAAHRVPLDELVGAPPTGDPRVRPKPLVRHGVTFLPLTRRPGGLQAYKVIVPAGLRREPEPGTHEGFEWIYVLGGGLRLLLGELDVVLRAGEVAEFDTRVPHWFGSADGRAVEFLSLFGPQGERMHVRAHAGR